MAREQTKHACEHNKIIKHPNYYLSEHSYSSEQQLRTFEEYKLVLQIAADNGLSQYMCQNVNFDCCHWREVLKT